MNTKVFFLPMFLAVNIFFGHFDCFVGVLLTILFSIYYKQLHMKIKDCLVLTSNDRILFPLSSLDFSVCITFSRGTIFLWHMNGPTTWALGVVW
ncbi:hypothetical protein ACJX0J_036484, partial [Zea mays]